MTRILLDTSAYSGFMRGVEKVVSAVQSTERIYFNPTVLGELRSGFAYGSRREKNEAELRSFLDSARVQVVSIDEDTSVFYAAIYGSLRSSGTPIPTNDLWIAASAMQHGLCLLTTDSHFRTVHQIIVQCVQIAGPGEM